MCPAIRRHRYIKKFPNRFELLYHELRSCALAIGLQEYMLSVGFEPTSSGPWPDVLSIRLEKQKRSQQDLNLHITWVITRGLANRCLTIRTYVSLSRPARIRTLMNSFGDCCAAITLPVYM